MGCLPVPGTGAGEIEEQRGSTSGHPGAQRDRRKETDIINRAWRGQRAAPSSAGSEKVPDADTHGVRRSEQDGEVKDLQGKSYSRKENHEVT